MKEPSATCRFIRHAFVGSGLGWISVFSLLVMVTESFGSSAINGHCSVRPQDEVWLISTRHLGCAGCCRNEVPILDVQAYSIMGRWNRRRSTDFLACNAGRDKPITVFYIHGNRHDRDSALRRGWMVYHALARTAPLDCPMRLVIWSWPSDQVSGLLHDVRTKAARADTDGYYLGWLLSQMDSQLPISLIGFSFGTRVALGGLHVSSGGSQCERRLQLPTGPSSSRVRLVALAGAEHNHWLAPGCKHCEAHRRIDRMFLIYNSCDPVLALYGLIDPRSYCHAMGFRGLASLSCLPASNGRIDQMDACFWVGARHDARPYFQSLTLMAAMSSYVFWEPLDPTTGS